MENEASDKKKDIKIIRIRAGLVFLVTLLLVFGCTFLVNQNQQRREKLKAAYTAESTISRIEVQLNRYLVESNLVKKSIEEGLTISDKQFATLSRLMQDEEDIIKVHEIAKDGIVVIVNNENKVDNMTKAQVNDVFRGTITDWSAIK